MAVAQLAHAGQVAVGRDEDAVRPHDRLEEDRRDRVRALVADHVLEAGQRLGRRPGLLLAPAMRVRVADDPVDRRLVGPAARVAGERHGPEGGAVVRPVAGEHLGPAREVAGELDRVLDRLRPAEGEEDLVEVARHDLGHLRAEAGPDLGGEGRLDVLQLRRLGRDRVDDPAVAVADVHRHQLAVEVDDPAAFGRVEVDPLGVVDRDGVDGALRGPREERVRPGEANDLLAGHGSGRGAGAHEVLRTGRRGPSAWSRWGVAVITAREGHAARGPKDTRRRAGAALRSRARLGARTLTTGCRPIVLVATAPQPPSRPLPQRSVRQARKSPSGPCAVGAIMTTIGGTARETGLPDPCRLAIVAHASCRSPKEAPAP